MALYIDNLDRFKNNLVIIKCGNSESGIEDITGVMLDEEVDLGTKSEFTDSDVTMGVDALRSFASKMAENVGLDAVSAGIKKKYNSIIQSAEDWQSGSAFEFSVRFNVFKNGKKGVGNCLSYRDFYSNLVKLTQPKPATTNDWSKYSPQLSHYDSLISAFDGKGSFHEVVKKKEDRLFTVLIGKWFECRLLQPTNFSFKLSSYTDTSGSPIYAEVSISFKTYRILDSKEWSSIIKL